MVSLEAVGGECCLECSAVVCVEDSGGVGAYEALAADGVVS